MLKENLAMLRNINGYSQEEIAEKIEILRKALETQSNRVVKSALMQVVPTYHTPEEVNEKAVDAEEIRIAAGA